MNTEWLWKLVTFSCYLLVPFRLLFSLLLYMLSWLLAPLLLLGHIVVHISMLPIRLLAQFETFYIFFGVAIAVGVIFGVVLHLIERSSVHLFGLDRPAPPRERAVRGHSASSYRAAREKKRLDEELRNVARSRPYTTEPVLGQGGKERDTRRPQMSPLSPPHARQRAGLLSTTILEEVDDSEDYGCD